jgi:putative SOS response-associated peptidase YedK
MARAMNDRTGNMPPLPGIFPDYAAPIVRNQPDSRELTMARWGMPSPVFALKGRKSDGGVTNVRNVSSPHWRRWLGIESRCVVPFTSFSENEALPDGSRPPIWFALDETRPLAFFAGIWTSVRKVKEGETTNDLFAFLTTEPNALVGTYHPKAMPVILTTPEEIDLWMTAPTPEALARAPAALAGRQAGRGCTRVKAGWRADRATPASLADIRNGLLRPTNPSFLLSVRASL